MIGHTSDERGSGTAVALGVIAALIVVVAVIHLLTAVAVAKAHASAGADLAALAAADTLRGLTTGDPCSVADQVATRNTTTMVECTVGGRFDTEVWITVSADISVDVGLSDGFSLPVLQVEHTSRAGPPEALP